MEGSLVKLTFLLTQEQMADYPVDRESIWCEKRDNLYKVKNIPLFIENISYEDLISVVEIGNNLFRVNEVIERSGNSTIWIFVKDDVNGSAVMDKLKLLKCRIEGGSLNGYFAVSVPSSLNIMRVYTIIDEAHTRGILVADYPSIQH